MSTIEGGGGEDDAASSHQKDTQSDVGSAAAATEVGGDGDQHKNHDGSGGGSGGAVDDGDLTLGETPVDLAPPPIQQTMEETMKEYTQTKKEIAGYKIRPDLDEKFRPGLVQVLIEKIVREYLEGQVFSGEETPKLLKLIMSDIHEKVKSQKYKRYKIITYVAVGERRGEGVSSATRCIWDAESDCLATYTFLNETIFCCATVYGIYYY